MAKSPPKAFFHSRHGRHECDLPRIYIIITACNVAIVEARALAHEMIALPAQPEQLRSAVITSTQY